LYKIYYCQTFQFFPNQAHKGIFIWGRITHMTDSAIPNDKYESQEVTYITWPLNYK
jgi:hypothetical protein